MHLRPAFAEADRARIIALIRAYSFGVLVTSGAGGLTASPIPFLLWEDGSAEGFSLVGHLAAENPQRTALDGGEALAIFQGPHAYVSPAWYRAAPAVPTWDYAAVHVSGRLRPMTDAADISAMMRDLAAHDPAGFDLAALPDPFRARMLAGIRAFTLVPSRVEAQWKMSQNRSVADRRGVIAGLRAQSDPMSAQTADLIEATLPGDAA